MSTNNPTAFGPLVLHDPDVPEADIVFIHGLGGDRKLTWTKSATGSTQTSCFWPGQLLPTDIPTARIITWGYAAQSIKAFDVVSVANPTQHAQKLCNELASLREGVEDRPLLFVAHSMGGIVIKKALLQSKDSNQVNIASIVSDTRGVIFMGTPHCGSKHADFAACLLKIVSLVHSDNANLMSALKNQDATLQELEHTFQQLLAKRRGTDEAIEVRCFYETVPMDSRIGVVVPPHSAAPPAYENSIAVDANHVGMTKFSGAEDQTYKNVLAELRRMIKLAKERKDAGTEDGKEWSRTTHIGDNDRGALAFYGSPTAKGNSGGTYHYGNHNTFN
ncbi:hypothetical protein HBH69_089920 [Parastagonospora nodorum]|nr:hypothetical protein HBH51_090210 [Parastagonospora nodorum]KAH4989471.1 hypothetical protein HBI76_073920 [Parastagonospora nodorum]KAH5156620.1 hypothetical protein HBH69_089920 [Parastagonospora nodorum]KAH5472460.1 hypothetical protein HBI28_133780 [Parastagonospora nodorum]KAH5629125.1 hypothetical protein HBI22_129690 [Parastagonospora nodorum]